MTSRQPRATDEARTEEEEKKFFSAIAFSKVRPELISCRERLDAVTFRITTGLEGRLPGRMETSGLRHLTAAPAQADMVH